MTLPKSDPQSAALVSSALLNGKIVIIPTDTVYGFSGISLLDGKKSLKDAEIDRIKGSEESKPLIELISCPEDIKKYTDTNIPQKILSKWPGPLTVIVENNQYYKEITGRASTAFRCPGDAWLRNVISCCASPIFSTSVNRSKMPVLERVSDIEREFSCEVALFVCDGDKGGQKPSTIVSLIGTELRVVRQGSVFVNE